MAQTLRHPSMPDAPGPLSPGTLDRRGVRLVFAALMAGTFLSALDQSILSTAMPTIVGELDGVHHQGWLMTAYILAIALVMPLYGKFGDLHGRRWPFLIAVTLFTAASAGAALAESFEQLVLWRGIQGLGGGGLIMLAQAIVADVVPASDRGRYLGPLGAVFAVATVVGPLLGGLFTQHLGWRWCFWVNIPVGLITFIAAWRTLRLPSRRSSTPPDRAGIALLVVATSGIVLLTSWGTLGWTGAEGYDWTHPYLLALLVATVGSVALFIRVEHRAADPVLPMHLFRNRTFVVTTSLAFLLGVSLFSAMTFLPTFLQMASGRGVTESGMLMLPMLIGTGLMTVVSGWLMARHGRYKVFPVTGMALATASIAWLATLTSTSSMLEFGVAVFALGSGLGLVLQTIVVAAQNAVGAHELGIATSTNNYFREIGAAVGVALFATIFTHRLTVRFVDRWPDGLADASGGVASITPDTLEVVSEVDRAAITDLFARALAPAFWYLVPLLVVGVVLTCLLREVPLSDVAGLVARGEAFTDRGTAGEGAGMPGVDAVDGGPAPRDRRTLGP